MSNSLLTPTTITRKALKILHQKLNFVGSINRTYDDRFAESGAKIGDTLTIRKPNRFTVTSGAPIGVQNVSESSTTLQVATQKHVAFKFGSAELTLTIDDFADRYLEPAMAVLSAAVEADAMTMYKDVYNQVNNPTAAISYLKVLEAGKKLDDELAPPSNRTFNMNTRDRVDLADALKGLFNPQQDISKMFRDGMLGNGAGFDYAVNTLWPNHTTGTAAGSVTGEATSSAYTLNGDMDGVSTLTVVPGSNAGTLTKGDIIVISGLNRVHPESKTSTGILQQFVVTASVAASATSITISPAIAASGATQNVATVGSSAAAIYKVGTTSDVYGLSMAYHRDAFAFATADLVLPKGVDFAAREVFDGISLRMVRQYDITNDTIPCRIDVLYGFSTIRPELACRVACN